MMRPNLPWAAQVKGFTSLPDIVVRGETYTGAYLSQLVVIDPNNLQGEAQRTPQLIFETGRLASVAKADAELAELKYRQFRECAVLERIDDGMSKTTAESDVRSTSDYRDFSEAVIAAQEAYSMLYALHEAAKSRLAAIKQMAIGHPDGGHGGTYVSASTDTGSSEAEPTPYDLTSTPVDAAALAEAEENMKTSRALIPPPTSKIVPPPPTSPRKES